MARRLRRRSVRVDLVVLAVVAVALVALLGTLFLHDQQSRRAASAVAYPQLTQSAQAVAVPTVAFIGDSYSAGTGSSGYDHRFTTLVAAYEGWSSRSVAYGGTGYLRNATTDAETGCGQKVCPDYQQVIAAVKAYNPSIVVVSGGRNDVGLAQDSVDTAIGRFFTDLRTALPNAKIIVTSPIWAYSAPPAQLAQIQTAVQAAAQQAGATYLDLKEPLINDRTLVAGDHVHPNDKGHAKLAQSIEVALSSAGSTPTPSP